MMRKSSKSLFLNLLIIVCVVITTHIDAQKLPGIQTNGLLITANLKIDGKADKWNGQFQAYNKKTGLFYSIANDAETLYLIVKATDPRVIEKLLNVGLKLTVSASGKKDYKATDNVTVTYPAMPKRGYQHNILINAGDKANWSGMPPQKPNGLFAQVLTRTDSTLAAANNALSNYANTINLTGVADLPDSTLSIYNEKHVRVKALFDSKGAYVYELSIPLKTLGITGNKISYSLKLDSYYSGNTFRRRDPVTNKLEEEAQDADPDINVITDFWGDYTLAKKP